MSGSFTPDFEGFRRRLEQQGFIFLTKIGEKAVKQTWESGFASFYDHPFLGETLQDCSFFHFKPKFIFRPKTTTQIQAIVRAAYQSQMPLSFAGGKTGLSGGYATPYALVDLETLTTLNSPYQIDLQEKRLIVDQNVLVSEMIAAVHFQSKGALMFPVQPSSALKLPVRIGGIIATNASGLAAGKLGATEKWLESFEILTPMGEIWEINSKSADFYEYIGTDGRNGVILNAVFRLADVAQNLLYSVLYGADLEGVFQGLQAVQDAKILPLTSEFIMANNNLPGLFGQLFQEYPGKWAILLKGTKEDLGTFCRTLRKYTEFKVLPLNADEFKIYLEERASLAALTLPAGSSTEYILFPGFEDVLVQPKDLMRLFNEINVILAEFQFSPIVIGYGHINFRQGLGLLLHLRLPVPITEYSMNVAGWAGKIARVTARINFIMESHYGIAPKAEHSWGSLIAWKFRDERSVWLDKMAAGKSFWNPYYLLSLTIESCEPPLNPEAMLARLIETYLTGKLIDN